MKTHLLICWTLVFSITLEAAQVRVIPTPDGGAVPQAIVDARGTIHLAYVKENDVFYAVSTNNGQSFSTPVRVNSEPGFSHPPHSYRGPDIAIGKGGRVHILWYSPGYQNKLPKDQWGVMYSHKDPAQPAFSKMEFINRLPSDNFAIAANSNGAVDIVWMAGELFLNSSSNNGDSFSPAVKLDFAEPCECCAARASYLSNGSLAIAYRERKSNIRDMYLAIRPPGAPVFSMHKASGEPWNIPACPMTGTFLNESKNGLIMAWETKGNVYFSRLAKDGSRASASEIKAPAKGGKWPVALMAPDGTSLVSWKLGTSLNYGLYGRDDAPKADVVSNPGKVISRHAGVVTANGDFLLID